MDNRKICIVAILLFSVFTAFSAIPSVQASIIYLPDDYPTIQSAVNAAYPGDTIIVGSGTYKENVIMDKKLTLIGDAFATIDAQGKGDAVNITADHCVVTGFRCLNATKSRRAGIKVNSDWNRIENNTCEKNNYGICLNDSSNNTISNNTVLNNKYGISLHHPPSPGLVEVKVNTPEYVEEKETFDVTIDVEGITDFNSGMFDLTFDNAVVKVDDVTDGSIEDTEILVAMWVYIDSDAIRVMLELPETTTVSGSGYLAKIKFKVKGKEGDISELNLSDGELCNVWIEEIPANWHGAEVKIGVEEEEPTPARNIQTGENTSMVQVAMNDPDAINVIVGGCSTENISVTGSEWSDAVTRVGADNNLISNNNILSNQYGIYLAYSSNNTLMNNIVRSNSEEGFYLRHSANNKIMNNKIYENGDSGICMCDSSNSIIASNEIHNNSDDGIYLRNSGNSTLTNNIISGSDHNFAVYGKLLSDYIQNIDASNKVEGKPVYYLVNKKSQRVPTDAGYVCVVNSTNITVKDLTLTNNSQGVLLAFSSNSKIENVNASNNKYGIYMDHSSDNVLMNNKVANNNDDCIYLEYSMNNEIQSNEISENKDNGICVYDSSNSNMIQNNEVRENRDDGIYLKRSTNTEITDNEIHENRNNGISILYSDSSNITNNNCSNNRDGIHLDYSNNYYISGNHCSSNDFDGIYLQGSNNSISSNNCSNNRGYGIRLGNSNRNSISKNTCSDNKDGIYLLHSNRNSILDNNCSSNSRAGIVIEYSNNNKLTGNIMLESGIVIGGNSLSNYTHEIDESNTVNGKPVYYWKDAEGGRILDGAGQVILVNCTKVTMEDQNLNNTSVGIQIAFSSDITIKNNNYSNNWHGIHLWNSSNNFIYLNNFINNTDNVYSYKSTNLWNSTEEITYTYNEARYINYLGNYWDDYTGTDADGDGIGDTLYSINGDSDNYPLMAPRDNYFA